MEEDTGGKILRRVREHYSRGFKSSNKIYELDESRRRDEKFWTKAVRRNSESKRSHFVFLHLEANACIVRAYNATSGNCGIMTSRVAGEVLNTGSSAYYCRISAPGDHAFCVVDYPLDMPTPSRVLDMVKHDYPGALVIDPWLNVCCRFCEYPARAKLQLLRWSVQGKRILFGKRSRPHDPIEPAYVDGFFLSGPLTFNKMSLVSRRHPDTREDVMIPLSLG